MRQVNPWDDLCQQLEYHLNLIKVLDYFDTIKFEVVIEKSNEKN